MGSQGLPFEKLFVFLVEATRVTYRRKRTPGHDRQLNPNLTATGWQSVRAAIERVYNEAAGRAGRETLRLMEMKLFTFTNNSKGLTVSVTCANEKDLRAETA